MAVVSGFSVLEMITRARTNLVIILVDNGDGHTYKEHKDYFSRAAEKGLLREVEIPSSLAGQTTQVHVYTLYPDWAKILNNHLIEVPEVYRSHSFTRCGIFNL